MPPCGSSMAPSPWGNAPNCCDRAADDSESAVTERAYMSQSAGLVGRSETLVES